VTGPVEIELTAENSRDFRYVLGHFATGVVAVTGLPDGVAAGLVVNSFTSVSLEPPLVSFCVARTSTSWPRLRSDGRICVCILAEDQLDACRRLATSGEDKFRGLSWTTSPAGLPLLGGSHAWLDCVLEAEHHAGDHDIVVARVCGLAASADTHPLVFHRGAYGRFTAHDHGGSR
jgi:3-hydroxy-9,10-secoandrosta-1,3,5(10)-triene-9,17-dione monooxygenase reductase component